MRKIILFCITWLVYLTSYCQTNQYLRGNTVWIQNAGGDSTRVKFETGNNMFFPFSTDLYTRKELGFFSKGYITTNLSGITVDSFLISNLSKNNLGNTQLLINQYPYQWFVGSYNSGIKNSLTLDSSTAYGFYYSGAVGSYYFPRTQPTSGQALVAQDGSGNLGWASVATNAQLNTKYNIIDTNLFTQKVNGITCVRYSSPYLQYRKDINSAFIDIYNIDSAIAAGGGGGSPTLSDILTNGNDAGGNDILNVGSILSTNGGSFIASNSDAQNQQQPTRQVYQRINGANTDSYFVLPYDDSKVTLTDNSYYARLPKDSGTIALQAKDSTDSPINMLFQGVDGRLHKSAVPSGGSGWAVTGTTTITGDADVQTNGHNVTIGENDASLYIQPAGKYVRTRGYDNTGAGNTGATEAYADATSATGKISADFNDGTKTSSVVATANTSESVVELNADRVYASGNVGVGTTAPSYPLDVAGTVNASGDIRTYAGNVIAADLRLQRDADGSIIYSDNDGTFTNSTIVGALQPTGVNNINFPDASGTVVVALGDTATLNFPSTNAGTSSDLTITVTGAADGDPVSLGVPISSQTTNGVFSAFVSAADTVKVRFTNTNMLTAIDPASGLFKVKVLK